MMVGSSGGKMIVNSGKWVCRKGVQAPINETNSKWPLLL